jgi:dihydroorotate dehydrogenase
MKNALTRARNAVISFCYKYILKPVFFRMDPEDIHDKMTAVGVVLGKFWITRGLTRLMFGYKNPALNQTVLGINFPNPVGLSAGFDKNAVMTDILPDVGFGFAEMGSITGEPCDGNPKPRLWRLKKSNSLVVYYGLKNDGCEAISKRLKDKKFRIPIGINVAKTNNQETCVTEVGIRDYVKAFKHFVHIGDYITINISCPNAFGGQPFTDAAKLKALLHEIDKIPYKKPVFLKLSPDLTRHEIDAIIEVAGQHRVSGFICSNLTKNRANSKILDKDVVEQGGLSGKVVSHMATDLIRYIYKKTSGRFVLIGLGGIFTAGDAYEKIKAGATLVELITGMIFEGPQVISSINEGLVRLLHRDGYKNISEAIGKES